MAEPPVSLQDTISRIPFQIYASFAVIAWYDFCGIIPFSASFSSIELRADRVSRREIPLDR